MNQTNKFYANQIKQHLDKAEAILNEMKLNGSTCPNNFFEKSKEYFKCIEEILSLNKKLISE